MKPWCFTRAEVAKQCREFGPQLPVSGMIDDQGQSVDPVQLMWAFALNESIHEKDGTLNCTPRFEPGYFEGRYALSAWQQVLNLKYGKAGASSYGNWQVMLCNAPGRKPEDFRECSVGALAFLKHVQSIVKAQKPQNIQALADAYNSGSCKDDNNPAAYIDRLVMHYHQCPCPKAEAAKV